MNNSKSEKAKVAQLCLTLCNPIDYSVHRILQARILEWVAFPFSKGLPNPGIKPRSPALQSDSLPAEPQGEAQLLNSAENSCFKRMRNRYLWWKELFIHFFPQVHW